jgi:DNA-binding NtrC family response regulator
VVTQVPVFFQCEFKVELQMRRAMKKSVLVIDDEKDLCNLISRVLEKDGFNVDCALNLAEGTQKLIAHPDIVILDNNLPDGNGLEYIQMHPDEFIQSFVIMISADSSADLQEGAAFAGITAFLTKPFSFDRMKKIIKSA